MTALERDAAFADLYIAKLNAEVEYKRNPNKETLERYLNTGREYSRQLRERQDEARRVQA